MLTFGRLGNVVDGLLHGGDVVGLLVGDVAGVGAVLAWRMMVPPGEPEPAKKPETPVQPPVPPVP